MTVALLTRLSWEINCCLQQEGVLHTPSQEAQDGRALGHGVICSCLLPEAQHQFDLLVGSVLQQLSLQGWQALASHLLLPSGVPATQSLQKVCIMQLNLQALSNAPQSLSSNT